MTRRGPVTPDRQHGNDDAVEFLGTPRTVPHYANCLLLHAAGEDSAPEVILDETGELPRVDGMRAWMWEDPELDFLHVYNRLKVMCGLEPVPLESPITKTVDTYALTACIRFDESGPKKRVAIEVKKKS